MKTLDYPPIWLIAFMALAYAMDRFAPDFGLDVALGNWAAPMGVVLFLTGLALTGAAVWEFSRAKTTIIPHRSPDALITSGVFRYSRNPIYLADVLMLSGAILYWGAVLALPLVALFTVILRKRFIDGEEKRLEDAFPTEFQTYYSSTRRWI